jgi:hypothetical protein
MLRYTLGPRNHQPSTAAVAGELSGAITQSRRHSALACRHAGVDEGTCSRPQECATSNIPRIANHADDLKHRLQREHDSHKKPRLETLYLLASEQAQTRQELAQPPGVRRHTPGRWLAIYAAGCLSASLAPYGHAGKPVSLAPAVLASLGQALRRPEGFASYEAPCRLVRQTHGVGSSTRRPTPSCARASAPR